jgi:uncharacterized protein
MKYLLIVLGLVTAPACAAGFDCARATAPDERAVCADPRLSELDELISRAFNRAKLATTPPDQKSSVVAIARTFLKDRQACKADRSCLLASYVGVLIAYQNFGTKEAMPAWVTAPAIAGGRAPSSGPLPTRIGQCSTTQVVGVTPRLDFGRPPMREDFDSGTAISYRNAGYQVSYGREPGLLNSKPGDSVLMCLIGIPHNCPPGDNRGRFYTVTNTRTAETWTLPDSEHSCGGA